MAPVFIYGTLKKGFALHNSGLVGAPYLGEFETVHPYPMYIAADFFGPMMLDRPGEGRIIFGELYEADEERLQRLDALEDVGSPGSFRSCLLVRPKGGGLQVDAIGFMKTQDWLNPLHSDHLSDYQDRRFIPPWER
jgi:gamma-glutamylaminecyclotransferase